MTPLLTQRAQKIVASAQEEAVRRGQAFILTEHLLLALLRDPDTDAARVLAYRGIAVNELRADLAARMEPFAILAKKETHLSPRVAFALSLAEAEADSFGHKFTGTEYLLLGLIAEQNGLAARLLAKQGLTLETARDAVIGALWSGRDVRIQPVAARSAHGANSANIAETQELARARDVILYAEKWGRKIISSEFRISVWIGITLIFITLFVASLAGSLALPVFGLLLLLSLSETLRRIYELNHEYKAARIVNQSRSKHALRPLICTMHWQEPKIRAGARNALMRLLPTLQTGDEAFLTLSDRIKLGKFLQSRSVSYYPNLALAILAAFERVGSADALPFVRPLTKNPPKTPQQTEIYEAANRCLRALEWRAANHDAHWTLLRSSSANADSPDVLLRPASAAGITNPNEMLRPSAPPEPKSPV